ncbi:MAG TPA: FAD:protein FMN transferase [Verrucomicrobiae bacterium]
MFARARFVLCALSAAPGVSSGADPANELPVVVWEGRTMGSTYKVQVVSANLAGPQLETLKSEVDERLREVNRQMSHYQPDSELSRFNRAPAHTPFKVSPEFARVVRFSLELNRRSRGAFDPALAPVINLWGFGEKTDQRAVPREVDLLAAKQKTGCEHLSVTAGDELVKDIPDLALNLSAVAKGFGVDEMVRILGHHGLTNIYASIAGEVRGMGHNPRGTNWQVGISAPVAHWRENDPMATAVSLANLALSTSGDYQKFFTDSEGRRMSHMLDPKTARPVQHSLAGVSVVASDNMTADALATTLFVLGPEDGLRFIETWPNAAALFIVRQPDATFRLVPSTRFAAMTGCRPYPGDL